MGTELICSVASEGLFQLTSANVDEYIMNINWIVWALLSFANIHETYNTSVEWVDSLTTYITRNSNINQVTFFGNPEHPIHPNMAEILIKVMENLPIVQINAKELMVQNSSILANACDRSSTSLYIYYHDARTTNKSFNKIIKSIVECFGFKARPKVLLILVTRLLHDSLQELLKYAWTQDLLDFTIIELCANEEQKKKIGVISSSTIPVIHQLNPFKKMHMRQNWTYNNEWFPNKLANMWDYPLKIGVIHRPPFSLTKFNQLEEPIEFNGPDSELIKNVGRVLNFSRNLLNFGKLLRNTRFNVSDSKLENIFESRKVDIFSHPISVSSQEILRSESIAKTKFCAIVPVLPRITLSLPVSFVVAPLISFAIVISFLAVKQMFRFRGQIWQPFNILRVLLGIGVDRRPMGNADRTIFLCLLFVTSIFSTNIYEALTNISLRTDGEIEFRSFEDLDSSGLTLMIELSKYNKTFAYSDGVLNNLKKKTLIRLKSNEDCLHMAVEYKNVTCIMSLARYHVSIESIESKKRKQLKVAEPCFWIATNELYLAKGSPYRSRINDALTTLRESGFINKWYNFESYSRKSFREEHLISIPERKENMRLIRNQLLAIAIVGYSLASVALIAEIVASKIVKYRWYKRLKIIRIIVNMRYRWRR